MKRNGYNGHFLIQTASVDRDGSILRYGYIATSY